MNFLRRTLCDDFVLRTFILVLILVCTAAILGMVRKYEITQIEQRFREEKMVAQKEPKGAALSFTASVPKNLTALPERSSHGWQDVKIRVHSRDAVKVRNFFGEAKHREREFKVSFE